MHTWNVCKDVINCRRTMFENMSILPSYCSCPSCLYVLCSYVQTFQWTCALTEKQDSPIIPCTMHHSMYSTSFQVQYIIINKLSKTRLCYHSIYNMYLQINLVNNHQTNTSHSAIFHCFAQISEEFNFVSMKTCCEQFCFRLPLMHFFPSASSFSCNSSCNSSSSSCSSFFFLLLYLCFLLTTPPLVFTW